MPTFIDESGDTGHSRDSLPYFRLAGVWMPSCEVANSFRHSVREVRGTLNLDSTFEFKFVRLQSSHDRVQAFFEVAMKHEFRFAVCGIDKQKGHWRTAPSAEQHWATATSLAVCLKPAYLAAETGDRPLRDPVFVDDNGDKDFLEAVKTAFRGMKSRLHPGYPMIANPKFRRSKPDEAMQLVDMICGATGAYIDKHPYWFEVIKPRCLGLIQLP